VIKERIHCVITYIIEVLVCCSILQLKVGFFNCILHVLVLQLAINTWGYALFDLGTFPEWAKASVATKSFNGTLMAALNGTDSLEASVDWFTTATVTF